MQLPEILKSTTDVVANDLNLFPGVMGIAGFAVGCIRGANLKEKFFTKERATKEQAFLLITNILISPPLLSIDLLSNSLFNFSSSGTLLIFSTFLGHVFGYKTAKGRY